MDTEASLRDEVSISSRDNWFLRQLGLERIVFFCLYGGAACCSVSCGPVASTTSTGELSMASTGHLSTAEDTTHIRFANVASQRGANHVWRVQPRPLRNLESFGTGCAFFDYDNNGWQDILLVDEPHAVLFRNRGNGFYRDVTDATGLTAIEGAWKGCAIGDVDGDGWLDVLLTGYRCLVLLHNQMGRSWQDVTIDAGLDPHNRKHWGSSAGFMDLDGNGTLDLVLLNYVVFGPQEKQYCNFVRGTVTGCSPREYQPEFPELWCNEGNGRFREATNSSGLQDAYGKALVVAFVDVNEDGLMDFYIGNDGTPAEFWLNLGGLRFHDAGVMSGIAFDSTVSAMAAMGADWGDYDGDGRLDLVVTDFALDPYALFHNLGNVMFEHSESSMGLNGPTYGPLGFGGKWLDMDNDGWLDLAFANGHVHEKAHLLDRSSTFRQPLMLFRNEKAKRFVDLVPLLGGDVAQPILGRGLATGDFDNDGRIDLLVVDYEGTPLLLQNRSTTSNHWLKLDLRSDGPNRFAYGAKLVARAGERLWVAHVAPASSYLSSSDPRVHFGLGNVQHVDTLTVHWPSGEKETWHDVPADRILTLQQGQGPRVREQLPPQLSDIRGDEDLTETQKKPM